MNVFKLNFIISLLCGDVITFLVILNLKVVVAIIVDLTWRRMMIYLD